MLSRYPAKISNSVTHCYFAPVSNGEGPLDDGSADRAHDRDERPDRRYHRLVAAFQRSWIDTMSLLRSSFRSYA